MTLPISGKDILNRTDIDSDYGSEFGTDDEATISTLLTHIESQSLGSFGNTVLDSIENDSSFPQAVLVHPSSAPVEKTRPSYVDNDEGIPFEGLAYNGPVRAASLEIEYDKHNRISFSCKSLSSSVFAGPRNYNPLYNPTQCTCCSSRRNDSSVLIAEDTPDCSPLG